MNRRQFLAGLAATTVTLGSIPAFPTDSPTNAELWYKQWAVDLEPIMQRVFNDTVIFGVGGYEQTDEYPFLKSIDPSEIYQQA